MKGPCTPPTGLTPYRAFREYRAHTEGGLVPPVGIVLVFARGRTAVSAFSARAVAGVVAGLVAAPDETRARRRRRSRLGPDARISSKGGGLGPDPGDARIHAEGAGVREVCAASNLSPADGARAPARPRLRPLVATDEFRRPARSYLVQALRPVEPETLRRQSMAIDGDSQWQR